MNIINFVVLLVRDDISICYPYHYCYCHYYSFLVKRCAWCAVGLVGASIDKLPRALGKVVGGGWRGEGGGSHLAGQTSLPNTTLCPPMTSFVSFIIITIMATSRAIMITLTTAFYQIPTRHTPT